MDLIEKALKLSIALRLIVGIGVVLFATPGMGSHSPGIILGAAVLGLAYVLRHQTWCLILLGIFCVFDLLGGMSGGLSIGNLPNIANATLSFVIICGIIHWFRDRNLRAPQS